MMPWDVRAPYVSVVPGTLDLNVHSSDVRTILESFR
jgi:hypothetical protein